MRNHEFPRLPTCVRDIQRVTTRLPRHSVCARFNATPRDSASPCARLQVLTRPHALPVAFARFLEFPRISKRLRGFPKNPPKSSRSLSFFSLPSLLASIHKILRSFSISGASARFPPVSFGFHLFSRAPTEPTHFNESQPVSGPNRAFPSFATISPL